jgi:endonuclease YncB( thermonuclease family)
VQALDGRTLATSALRIRLSGLELPPAEEICRTLDGRLEACAARAATQLELMTRHRKVSCRYRIEVAGEAVGACRIGGSDLAERLVRTGFVKRSVEAVRIAAAPAAAAN